MPKSCSVFNDVERVWSDKLAGDFSQLEFAFGIPDEYPANYAPSWNGAPEVTRRWWVRSLKRQLLAVSSLDV